MARGIGILFLVHLWEKDISLERLPEGMGSARKVAQNNKWRTIMYEMTDVRLMKSSDPELQRVTHNM